MVTLSEIKSKNKRAGQFFFERGSPPVVSKQGNYLVTRGYGSGYVLYKYSPATGKVSYQQSSSSKATLVNIAKKKA